MATVQKRKSHGEEPRNNRVTVLMTDTEVTALELAARPIPYQGNISLLIRTILRESLGINQKETIA